MAKWQYTLPHVNFFFYFFENLVSCELKNIKKKNILGMKFSCEFQQQKAVPFLGPYIGAPSNQYKNLFFSTHFRGACNHPPKSQSGTGSLVIQFSDRRTRKEKKKPLFQNYWSVCFLRHNRTWGQCSLTYFCLLLLLFPQQNYHFALKLSIHVALSDGPHL